jgi:hypothetical protein
VSKGPRTAIVFNEKTEELRREPQVGELRQGIVKGRHLPPIINATSAARIAEV